MIFNILIYDQIIKYIKLTLHMNKSFQTYLIENQDFENIGSSQILNELTTSFNLIKFLQAKLEKSKSQTHQIKIYEPFIQNQNQLTVISKTQKMQSSLFILQSKRNFSRTENTIQFFELVNHNNRIRKQDILKEYKNIKQKGKQLLSVIAVFSIKEQSGSDQKLKRRKKQNSIQQIYKILGLSHQHKAFNLPQNMTLNYLIRQTQSVLTLPFNLSKCWQSLHANQKNYKHYECVIRPFERMLTHIQYKDLIQRHLKSYRSLVQKQRNVKTHFISHLGNCFIAFLLSVSHLIKPQKLDSYVNKYIDIKFKFQTLQQSKDEKGNGQLKKSQFKEIAKNIKFLIHNLLLQYEKQIVSLSAELSFIFEIVQLINDSLISFEFTDKCISLLQLYGRRFPQILLKSQKWIQLCSTTNSQGKSIMSLLKMLEPGVISNSRQKFATLINEICLQINSKLHNDDLTFQKHFQLTGNNITFVGIDITSKKTRFFNSCTTPNMNFLDFLVLNQYYESINFHRQYEPFYVNFENSCNITNISGNSVVPLVGVNTLEQFTDNTELLKRYFCFAHQSQKIPHKKHRIILQGQLANNTNIYQDRLRIFRERRRQLISQLKQVVISSIPKTKLLWKFIRYSPPKQKSQTQQERKQYFQVLKRVQVFNYCFDFYRSIKSHDRNLNKEIWKSYTLQTQVTQLYYNYAMVGKQKQKLDWEKTYIKKLQSTLQQEVQKYKKDSKYQNSYTKNILLNQIQKALKSLQFYETHSYLQVFHIKNLFEKQMNTIVRKTLHNSKVQMCSQLKQLIKLVQQFYNQVNKCETKEQLISILVKLRSQIQKFKQNSETKQCFLKLQIFQFQELEAQVQSLLTTKLNENQFFKSQSLINSHKMKIIDLADNLITLPKKQIKKRLHFDLGMKEVQQHDIISQYHHNFKLKIQKLVQNATQNGGKINLFAESTQYSEHYCSVYIKLLFQQICNKFGSPNKIDIEVALQKIQSITCTNYHTIILLNIFLASFKPVQSFNQIVKKLPNLKNLFLLQNGDKVQTDFGTYKWHLIDQANIQKFYKEAYSKQYIQFLKKQSRQTNYQQITQIIKKSTKNPNKTKQCEIFKKRRQIQIYLGYEVLQQLIESKIKKKNVSLKDIINKKIQYNNTLLEQYSAIQKKQIIALLNKFMTQLQNILNLLITTSLQNHPPVYNIWKSVLLKNSISILRIRQYIISMLNQYGFQQGVTFLQFHQAIFWKGSFNIMLWNLRRKCVEICNYLTKPHMPILVALMSACSQPFYTCQQYSHHRWQKPIQQNTLFTTFHQFSQKGYRNSQVRLSVPPIQFKKTQSKIVQEYENNLPANRVSRASRDARGNRLSRVVKSTQMQNLLDQKVNSYLCPNSLAFYPLLFLTNPCLTPLQISVQKDISQRKWIIFSFDQVKQNFFQRFKRPQTGDETKLTFGQIFNLYLNKKDDHVNTLRLYLKKFIRQTHYYLIAKTFQEGTANLYKYYIKVSQDSSKAIQQIMEESSSQISSYTSEDSNERNIDLDYLLEDDQKFKGYALINLHSKKVSLNHLNDNKIILQQDVYQVDRWGDLIEVKKKIKVEQQQVEVNKQQSRHRFLQTQENIISKQGDKKANVQKQKKQLSEVHLRQNTDNQQRQKQEKPKQNFIRRLCCCIRPQRPKSEKNNRKNRSDKNKL